MAKGFTLIEVLIVVAIMAVLAGLTAPALVRTFGDYSFASEREIAASLFHRARASAMTGQNSADHGVKIASASYVEFEGATYAARDPSKDFATARNADITVTGGSEVVFARLTGRSASQLLTFSDGINTASIAINLEGLISW